MGKASLVDRLKDLNLAFQNTGADQILHGIFEILRNGVPADAAYRLGGDEAGALLAGISAEQADRIAGEVRATVERTFASNQMPNGCTPTVSIGVGTIHKRMAGLAFEQAVEFLRAEAKKKRNCVLSGTVG